MNIRLGMCCTLLWGIFSSCHLFEKKEADVQDSLLAKVGEYTLSIQEAKRLAPDPIHFNQWVKRWVLEHILWQKAQKDPRIDNEDIEYKVQRYRMNLIIHALEQQYLQKYLENEVEETEIRHYYEKKIHDYVLPHAIVQGRALRIPIGATFYDSLVETLRFSRARRTLPARIARYCQQFTDHCIQSDTTWIEEFRLLQWFDSERQAALTKQIIGERKTFIVSRRRFYVFY